MKLKDIFFNNKTILFSFILLFASCANNSDCKKITLSKKDLSWFNCYKKGQILYFKNQFDDIDTMIVYKNIVDFSPCNKFELGEFQFQLASIRLNNKNDKNLITNRRVQVNFNQEENGKLSSKSFYVFDYSFWDGYDLDKELKDTAIYLKYYNKKEINCLVFDPKFDRSHDDSNNDLDTFFWSKELGLVKYILHDTLIYKLYKN